ncbi:hypothetical protein CWE06_11455 [Aliidiomarina haloalkalitolerans]|uniref:Uncharacterized protein n=1 Tax=Aliidiomarina haloalkalitolerans TaxID=859059 RepID=A0A432VPZ0_9GAMM|nr:hypothetical protein CWE06_11455 [Aliidiomarina haloalkalitolerans]
MLFSNISHTIKKHKNPLRTSKLAARGRVWLANAAFSECNVAALQREGYRRELLRNAKLTARGREWLANAAFSECNIAALQREGRRRELLRNAKLTARGREWVANAAFSECNVAALQREGRRRGLLRNVVAMDGDAIAIQGCTRAILRNPLRWPGSWSASL